MCIIEGIIKGILIMGIIKGIIMGISMGYHGFMLSSQFPPVFKIKQPSKLLSTASVLPQ